MNCVTVGIRMFGFSLLMSSNFVQTIYFGLLVAFTMLLALLANLVLLPLLLVLFKNQWAKQNNKIENKEQN